MKKEHTKGPWKIANKFKGSLQPIYYKLKTKPITSIHWDELSYTECRANAKLIAAAPELFEAAQYALDCLPNYGVDSIREKLTNAIKKATHED